MNIRPLGAMLFNADRRTDGHDANSRFRNFANAPKTHYSKHCKLPTRKLQSNSYVSDPGTKEREKCTVNKSTFYRGSLPITVIRKVSQEDHRQFPETSP